MEPRLFLGILLQTISWIMLSAFYVQPELPVFSESPESLTLQENSMFTLNCTLHSQETPGGVPRPQIQWRHNGVAVTDASGVGVVITSTSNATSITSQLAVHSSLPEHAGYYQCMARDGTDATLCSSHVPHPCIGMSMLSETGWIYVVPRNGGHRDMLDIQVSESALLRCGSDFLNHATPTMWLKDGNPLTDTSTEFLLVSGDVVVYGQDNGTFTTYECFVSVETEEVLYRSYDVMITETGDDSDASTAVFTTSGAVLQQEEIQLACSVALSNSSSNSTVDLSWTRDDSSPIERGVTSLNGRVLRVGGATINDTGSYCCVAGEYSSCAFVAVVTTEADATSIYIQQVPQMTNYSVQVSCPVPHSIPIVDWYRNGVRIYNMTEKTIRRTSDDPYQLYGVYQCSVATLYQHVLRRRVLLTVARVLPHGISNPVRGLQYQQYLYPPQSRSSEVDELLLLWEAPNYRGNLSSLFYRVTRNGMTEYVAETHHSLVLQKHSYNEVYVAVLDADSNYQDASMATRIIVTTNTFYPPKINNMTCSSGAVEIHYEFDVVANDEFSVFRPFSAPKLYYFYGGCRDENNQLIYRVNYAADNGSSYFLQGGVAFKAGTWCTVKAGNTPAQAVFQKCLNERYILYSEYSNCFVSATVGFERAEYIVEESSGHARVCVRSKGYGFNLTVSLSPSNTSIAKFESAKLVFDSVMVTRRCVNVTIVDDQILGDSTETSIQLTVATSNPYVVMETNSTTITVLEDDVVTVKLDSASYTVPSDEEGFYTCVTMTGMLGKNITVTMTTEDGSAKVGVDFPVLSKSIFFGVHSLTNSHCVFVPIYPHVRDSFKTFSLVLTASSYGVWVRDFTHVTIFNRQSTTIQTGATSTDNLVWISVGVAVGIVTMAVLVVIILIIWSHFFMERLKTKERVMDTNFRRRPLMEPHVGLPPSSWPDPVAVNSIFPKPPEEDKYSDICNLDYYGEYPMTTAVADSNKDSESATISPMISVSTIGGASVTSSRDWRRSVPNRSDCSSSTVDEYINPFLGSDTRELSPEMIGQSKHIPSKSPEEDSAVDLVIREGKDAMDQEVSAVTPPSELGGMRSPECLSSPISTAMIRTKILDQDSGFDMQDTSAMSFTQDRQSCSDTLNGSKMADIASAQSDKDVTCRESNAAASNEFMSADHDGEDSGCHFKPPSQFYSLESDSRNHTNSCSQVDSNLRTRPTQNGL